MKFSRFVIMAFAALLFAGATPAFAAETIGTILEVEGTATVQAPGQQAVPAAVNMDIHEGDVVASGPQSKVFIQLMDDTQFTLSEKAVFAASEYDFDADETADNKARYSVTGGAFKYVSGLMTKKKDPDAQIDTPVGSIGVRGTALWGGDIDNAYGIHVDEGEIVLAQGPQQLDHLVGGR